MKPCGIITLLTDFGLEDGYVGIVKGVILGINPSARIVDISHLIPHGSILDAALVLQEAWHFFPEGTVHLAIVDPGVGTSPGDLWHWRPATIASWAPITVFSALSSINTPRQK